MQVNEKLMRKWVALKSKEDVAKIAENANVTPQSIRNVFREKKCSTHIFTAIAKFYKEKGELLKEFI